MDAGPPDPEISEQEIPRILETLVYQSHWFSHTNLFIDAGIPYGHLVFTFFVL